LSEEKKKLRFIREEPWIAQTLRTFRPLKIVPEDLHDWFWDWVQDVGAVMRSREMMVGFVASIGYYALALGLMNLFSRLGFTGLFKRLLGP
jgi:hypothetical protein